MEEREIRIKVQGKKISFETLGGEWTCQEVVQTLSELLNGIIQSNQIKFESGKKDGWNA